MERSVAEILASSRALRKEAPSKKKNAPVQVELKPYVPPPMHEFVFKKLYEILAPVGFAWADYDYIINGYYDEVDWTREDHLLPELHSGELEIYHGHSRGFSCALPHQCHVVGWRPPTEAPEEFKTTFYRKFKYEGSKSD